MADASELLDTTDATGIAAAIRTGATTAAEVLEASLARIDERNPTLNAVVARRDEAARAEVAAGLPDGPLTGVPVVVKVLGAQVAGMPDTRGSRLFADVVAEADSELVARYRRAGAVVVGMSNTPELGRNGSTEPALHGPTRNPYRTTHSVGGSSGGTGAAVAGGLVPVGHANDGGGSIRIPASMCGLVGLKPSRGRVSALPALTALGYPLGINHALTRTVRDSALLLDVAQGPVAGDPYVVAPPTRPYVEEVGAAPGRLRIARTVAMPSGLPVDDACVAAVDRAAALLAEAGHVVEDVDPPWPFAEVSFAGGVFLAVPLALEVDARLAELGRGLVDDDLEPLTRSVYEGAKAVSGTQVVAAHQAAERASRVMGAFHETYDLLLTPTVGCTPPPIGTLDTADMDAMRTWGPRVSGFTVTANVTGQPAISLPVGEDELGMPVGVQLLASFGREDLLLRVAAQLEAVGAWDPAPVWPPRG